MVSEKQMKHILKVAKLNKERYKKYGHNRKGKHHTEETKKIIGKKNFGKNNGMWKGDNVGYGSLHEWIKNRKPKPKFCEICKIKPPIDLANISGKYKRDLSDWEWLCRKCHMIKDGRYKKMKKGINKRLK